MASFLLVGTKARSDVRVVGLWEEERTEGSPEKQGFEGHGAWSGVVWILLPDLPLRVALSPGGEVPTSFPISDGSGTDRVWAYVGLGPHRQLGVFFGAIGFQDRLRVVSLGWMPPPSLIKVSQWMGVKTGPRVREESQPRGPHHHVTNALSKTQVFMS